MGAPCFVDYLAHVEIGSRSDFNPSQSNGSNLWQRSWGADPWLFRAACIARNMRHVQFILEMARTAPDSTTIDVAPDSRSEIHQKLKELKLPAPRCCRNSQRD